jgi:FolB domain-containing protein
MTHYAHILSANRLQLAVNLGFYTGERAKPQPVEICFRLYFPEEPPFGSDDDAEFIDYGMVCKALKDFVDGREFKLVEFMAMELFRHLRALLDGRGASDVKLWLRLNKISAPVPGLTGGASFIHCDLPVGATTMPCGE